MSIAENPGNAIPPASGKPLILGLGGEGAAIVEQLALLPGIGAYTLALIDTDSSSVERSSAAVKLNAAADWGVSNGGMGCGGNVIRGERALAKERNAVGAMLKGTPFLTVTGGLGGGTATGGIRTIQSVARSLRLPSVFLLTTPFSFESYSRRRNAAECIRELLPVADVLLTLPNDLLFSCLSPDTPAACAFERSALEMARTAFGVAELMRCRNLLGADYASFMAPVKGMRCNCCIGVGAADSSDGLDRCAIALERMLSSPFLGGLDQLKKASAVYLVLAGGNDLQIAEMKRLLEQASEILPPDVELFTGAAVSEKMEDRIQLTAIAVNYENPLEKSVSGMRSGGRPRVRNSYGLFPSALPGAAAGPMMQEEFTLTSFSRGIFENLPPTRYQDEDLDVPTFQRRNISIDRGKPGAGS